MTVLYTNNWDATPNGLPADFTIAMGSGLYVVEASAAGLVAVSGTKIVGRNSNNDAGYHTATGVIGNSAIRTDFCLNSLNPTTLQHVAHVLRGSATFSTSYWFQLISDGSTLGAMITDYSNGSTTLTPLVYGISASVGDVVHMESKAIGSVLECRVWVGSAARPTAPTCTVTNTSYATGYVGLIKIGPFNWAGADNLVITDGAGGEGFFDVASSATATTMTAGSSSGTTGTASTNFTVGANGTITGTVIVTPSDAANGGTFTPTTVSISSGTPTATFTYTPASTGAKTISVSNNGGLTNAVSLTYTSNASADTTVPTLTGSITSSLITQTTYTLSWPTGADNVAVTAYEYNINGGAFVDNGTATTVNITGRTASTTDTITVRAKDAAGNMSTPVLSTTVNLLAATTPAITTPVLKNNTGTVLASETGVVVNVYNASTGALVLQKTGLTSDGSGIVTFTDAALAAATSYAYEVVLSGGRRRLPLVTTA